MDTIELLRTVLAGAGAHRVADLGCGDGTLAATLAGDGFAVTGVDPSAEALAAARRTAPGATFVQAKVEDFASADRFDAACFVNALHHVAVDRMRDALAVAAAIVRPGGPVVIVEPLAEGSFFAAMRPVEDETAIRAAAASAVDAAVGEGLLVLRQVHRWERESRFDGIDDFVAYLVRVDPARAALAQEHAGALGRAWEANVVPCDGRAMLVQPMIGWELAAPSG